LVRSGQGGIADGFGREAGDALSALKDLLKELLGVESMFGTEGADAAAVFDELVGPAKAQEGASGIGFV
jgi:hypothetical protein